MQRDSIAAVSVRNSKGQHVGMGCYVGRGYVVTCAHVVRDATAASREPGPTISFLFAPGKPALPWRPLAARNGVSDDLDVALVELLGSPPEVARSPRYADAGRLVDCDVAICGIGDGGHDHWVYARTNRFTSNNKLQISGQSSVNYFIAKGFSGSPVFSRDDNGVLGIIQVKETSSALREAFAVPYTRWNDAYPELVEIISSGTPRRPQILLVLPRELSDLVGRKKELRMILSAIGHGRNKVTLICGMPGVGKSTLCYRAIESARATASRTEVAVDVSAYRSDNSTVERAASVILRSLIVRITGEEPEDFDLGSLRDGWTRLSDEQDILFLVDNADWPQLVKLLLPSAWRGTIILSCRGLLNIPSADFVEVKPLPARDAERLVMRVANGGGRRVINQADAALVARECECLPLALVIVATKLRNSPPFSVPLILGDLVDEGRRIQHVDGEYLSLIKALQLSRRGLSESDESAWTSLAVFPGSFGIEASAAIVYQDAGAALDSLMRLTSLSIVEATSQVAEGRFRLHRLVRDFCSVLLRERNEDIAGLKKRHAEYYVMLLRRAEASITVSPEGRANSFQDDLPNIVGAMHWLKKNWNAGEQCAELALAAPLLGSRWLKSQVYAGNLSNRDMEDWLAAGVLAADYLLQRAAELDRDAVLVAKAKLLINLSEYLILSGNYGSAARRCRAGIAVLRGRGRPVLMSYLLCNLGTARFRLCNFQGARRAYSRALSFIDVNAAPEMPLRGKCLSNQAIIAQLEGNVLPALRLLRTSARLARISGDATGLASALHHAGQCLWYDDRIGPAQWFLMRALGVARASGDRASVALIFDSVACCLADTDAISAAAENAKLGLKEARVACSRYAVCENLASLAYCYFLSGDFVSALVTAKESLASGAKERAHTLHLIMALSEHRLGRRQEAVTCIKLAIGEADSVIHLLPGHCEATLTRYASNVIDKHISNHQDEPPEDVLPALPPIFQKRAAKILKIACQ